MDFLDRFALWLSKKPKQIDSYSESTTENESDLLREAEVVKIDVEEEAESVKVENAESDNTELDNAESYNTESNNAESESVKSESIEVESIEVESPRVIKLKIKKRKSFAESNYKAPEKVFNDNYIENISYSTKRDKNLFIEKILPFLNSKQEWAEWAYRNRYGVFTTVALYLSILFGFSMMTFDVGGGDINSAILIEFQEDLIEELEREKEINKEELNSEDATYDSKVSNQISDANSDATEDFEEEYEKVEYIDSEKLLQEAEDSENAVYQKMSAYNAGLDSLNRKLLERRRLAKIARDSISRVIEREKESNFTRKKGNVTVSYDLDGRHAIFLEIPAYLCEGGGKVILDIVVNRMGKVVSATVKKTYGVTDYCVEEMAVWATLKAEFNMKNDAPARQKGTMTYIFVAQ